MTNKKYTSGFYDIDGNEFSIDIYRHAHPTDTSYTITTSEHNAVQIRHSSGDKNSYEITGIQGQELLYTFYIPRDYVEWIDTLMKSNYMDYVLDFKEEPSGNLLFRGFIKAENIVKRFEVNPPFIEVKLSAVDGLAGLKDIDFADDDAVAITGSHSILSIIKQAINKITETDVLNLDFKIQLGTYETTHMTSSECALDKIAVNAEAFFEDNEDEKNFLSCWDVINSILQPFNLLLKQIGGYYYITNYHELESYVFTFDFATLTEQSRVASNNVLDVSSYNYTPYVEHQKIVPFKKVTTHLLSRAIAEKIESLDIEDWTNSWTYQDIALLEKELGEHKIAELTLTNLLTTTEDADAPYMETDGFYIDKYTETTYFEFSFWFVVFSITPSDYAGVLALKLEVVKPGDIWSAPIYLYPSTDKANGNNIYIFYKSPQSDAFKVSESGNYKIRITFLTGRANITELEVVMKFPVLKYGIPSIDATTVTSPVDRESTYGRRPSTTTQSASGRRTSSGTSASGRRADRNAYDQDQVFELAQTEGVVEFETDILFADGYATSSSGTLHTTSGINPTRNWVVEGGNTRNESTILTVYANNLLVNRGVYKNYLQGTIFDPSHNISFNSILQIQTKYYLIIAYNKDYKDAKIQIGLIEILTGTLITLTSAEAVEHPRTGGGRRSTGWIAGPIDAVLGKYQAAHGFEIGDIIRYDGTVEKYVKAQADTVENAKAVAIVSEIIDNDAFRYISDGDIFEDTHLYEFLNLKKGEYYFISEDTAGKIVAQPDLKSGQIEQCIGFVTTKGFKVEIDARVIEVPTETIVVTEATVTGDGAIATPVTLVNDEETPAALNYYGTDATATKGFHDLLAIIKASITDETKHKTAVDNTTLATYTYKTNWSTNLLSAALGHFTVNVLVKNKTTDEITTLKNVFSWDYVDATDVEIDNEIVIDADSNAMTLVLDIESDGMLSATLSNMSTNPKRLFFCFERCIAVVEDLSMGAEGTFELNGVAAILANGGMQASGLLSLNAIASMGGVDGALAATGAFALNGVAGIFIPCFGYLYNWYMVEGTGDDSITSGVDWYVPSATEYNDMAAHIGGTTVAGGKVKIDDDSYWGSGNEGTNDYGFNAKGSGRRTAVGVFDDLLEYGMLWTSTVHLAGVFSKAVFLRNISDSMVANQVVQIEVGLAIRVVKDATGLADGVTTTYTGNDGKTYNAIVINELYWVTQNLEETEYRNNSTISNVTDATAWGLLITGAWCVYDNNNNYKCKG